jgi:hypothetical protein
MWLAHQHVHPMTTEIERQTLSGTYFYSCNKREKLEVLDEYHTYRTKEKITPLTQPKEKIKRKQAISAALSDFGYDNGKM